MHRFNAFELRKRRRRRIMSCQFTCNCFSLSSVACELGHNEARNPFIRWSCATGGCPLGEQIYVLEGKKRISGGSHQRRRYRWQAAEMSGNWVNDLIGGHKFSNRRIWFYWRGFDDGLLAEKSEWEINKLRMWVKRRSHRGMNWRATIYLSLFRVRYTGKQVEASSLADNAQ